MSNSHNPIDKDKITDQPHLLSYAHHIGSAIIKPIDKGKEKGLSVSAMYQQTDIQLNQIKEQVAVLLTQAQEIHDRIDISEKIYNADIGFKPITGNVYYLYQKKDGHIISIVSPKEWGSDAPFTYLATVTLLSDHTWKVNQKSEAYLKRFKSQ